MQDLFFHPKIVHVPIGLAAVLPVVAIGVLAAWWRGWVDRRTWLVVVLLQAMLAGGAALALKTGEEQEDRVEDVVGEDVIEEHEEAAEVFLWTAFGVLALAVGGAALPGDRTRKLVASAAAAGTVLVLGLGVRVGQSGGSLVYEHGAAQVYVRDAGGTEVPLDDLDDLDGSGRGRGRGRGSDGD